MLRISHAVPTHANHNHWDLFFTILAAESVILKI